MSASTTETYNGWSNYPTWAVNLWLSNDESLYRATLELVESTAKLYAGPYFVEKDVPRYQVADALKDMVEEMLPDLGASFAADLLGYAVDRVDWREIADSWIEDVSAEVEL